MAMTSADCVMKQSCIAPAFVMQDAATLAVFQAIDFGQQEESEAAHQILMNCSPASRLKLQNTFLCGVCLSADVGLALEYLQRYSQQDEEPAQLYRTVLARLARCQGKHSQKCSSKCSALPNNQGKLQTACSECAHHSTTFMSFCYNLVFPSPLSRLWRGCPRFLFPIIASVPCRCGYGFEQGY